METEEIAAVIRRKIEEDDVTGSVIFYCDDEEEMEEANKRNDLYLGELPEGVGCSGMFNVIDENPLRKKLLKECRDGIEVVMAFQIDAYFCAIHKVRSKYGDEKVRDVIDRSKKWHRIVSEDTIYPKRKLKKMRKNLMYAYGINSIDYDLEKIKFCSIFFFVDYIFAEKEMAQFLVESPEEIRDLCTIAIAFRKEQNKFYEKRGRKRFFELMGILTEEAKKYNDRQEKNT